MQIEIDALKREVKVNGEIIEMSVLDFDLTIYLARNKDNIFDRKKLLISGVWDNEFRTPRVVDQAIVRLRKLYGKNSIKTIIRKGYKWNLPNVIIKNDHQSIPTGKFLVDPERGLVSQIYYTEGAKMDLQDLHIYNNIEDAERQVQKD